MIPNLIWTALFLTPITIFCYDYVPARTIYILLGISLIPIFFPNAFFDKMQLSKSTRWYRRIGVKYVSALAQNGALVNRILRKKYPTFKVVSGRAASIKKQYYQTYFLEKFHFSLFLFFIMITIGALMQGHYYWALTLTISNLLYNVYPNLLQQYIRLKLRSFIYSSNK